MTKRPIPYVVLLLIALLPALSLLACGDTSNGTENPVSPTPPPSGSLSVSVRVSYEGVSGVAVSLEGPTSKASTTNSSGTASFEALTEGTYTVSISGYPADHYFAEATQSVSLSAGDSRSVVFSGNRLEITTDSLTPGVVGEDYSARLEATGGSGSYTWSIADGALPDGLSLSSDGVVSGTPTSVATGSCTFQVSSGQATANRGFPLVIEEPVWPPVVETTELPGALVGDLYSDTLMASEGDGAYEWALLEGNLPTGLTLSGNGVLSGTPSGTGLFPFRVQVTSAEMSDTADLSLTVSAGYTEGEVATVTTGADGFSAVQTESFGGIRYEMEIKDPFGNPLPDVEIGYTEIADKSLLVIVGPTEEHIPGLLYGHPDSLAALAETGASSVGVQIDQISIQTPDQAVGIVVGVVALGILIYDGFQAFQAGKQIGEGAYDTGSFYWEMLTSEGQCVTYRDIAEYYKGKHKVKEGAVVAGLTLAPKKKLGDMLKKGVMVLGAEFIRDWSAARLAKEILGATEEKIELGEDVYAHDHARAWFDWLEMVHDAVDPFPLKGFIHVAIDPTDPFCTAKVPTNFRAVSSTELTGSPETVREVLVQAYGVGGGGAPNVEVHFDVSAGGGGVKPAEASGEFASSTTVTTGHEGYAAVDWKFGPSEGQHVLEASVDWSGYGYTFSAQETFNATVQSFPPVKITTTSLPDGEVGEFYYTEANATGGNGSYDWSVTAGSVPSGLFVDSAGIIWGQPSTAGSSSFTLQVVSGGLTDTQDLSIMVTEPNGPPTAEFDVSCTNLSCSFADQSTDGDGSVQSWSWNFGDGGSSSTENPSHTYSSGGTYTVTLTVTDDDGATDTATESVTVTESGSGDLGTGFGDEQFELIPAGTFQMGDITGNGYSNELPVHTVNITQAFYMQKTEVTQAQWQAVMGSNPSSFSDCGDTCPVEEVSWNDIQDFLAALNAMYPDRNYRLPTEAEWEYAARAGTTGDYGGTGVLDEMGWYRDNSEDQTHPAAQKQPNDWGLYDMHGNVFEWVQDWYDSDYYSVSPTDDPQGPSSGTYRVFRGGSWHGSAKSARSALRNYYYPSGTANYGGFRLARTK